MKNESYSTNNLNEYDNMSKYHHKKKKIYYWSSYKNNNICKREFDVFESSGKQIYSSNDTVLNNYNIDSFNNESINSNLNEENTKSTCSNTSLSNNDLSNINSCKVNSCLQRWCRRYCCCDGNCQNNCESFYEQQFDIVSSTFEGTTPFIYVGGAKTITFFAENLGTEEITIYLENSPNQVNITKDAQRIIISPNATVDIVPYKFSKYIRMVALSNYENINCRVWFQMQQFSSN